MSEVLHNTQDWTFDRISEYGKAITAAMKKLHDKFPRDGTPESMMQDIVSGAIQLWLALKGDEFKGILLTDIQTVPATGIKSVRIVGASGEDGSDFLGQLGTVEEWAWSIGADDVIPVGRVGWKKPLALKGYEVDRVVYRKARPE